MTYYNNDKSWTDEINDFVDCIIHDKPIYHGSIEDAIMTMDLVQRIYNDDNNWSLKAAKR